MDNNYTIKIQQDENADSPRSWDNLGTIAYAHRHYKLGEEQLPEDHAQWYRDRVKEGCIILPVYAYEHGGITISTGAFGCPWDSGQMGWIYVKPEKIKAEYGNRPYVKNKTVAEIAACLKNPPNGFWKNLIESAERCLNDEIETFDQYLTGDIWGYTIEDQDGDLIDSCRGFYGYDECEQEAERIVEYLKKKDAQHWGAIQEITRRIGL